MSETETGSRQLWNVNPSSLLSFMSGHNREEGTGHDTSQHFFLWVENVNPWDNGSDSCACAQFQYRSYSCPSKLFLWRQAETLPPRHSNHVSPNNGSKPGPGGPLGWDDDIRRENTVRTWQCMKSSTEPMSHESVGVKNCWNMVMSAMFCVISTAEHPVMISSHRDIYRVNEHNLKGGFIAVEYFLFHAHKYCICMRVQVSCHSLFEFDWISVVSR